MKTKILPTILLAFWIGSTTGQIIHVPTDQPTIQAAIDAAMDGDTVLVFEGTYFENIVFKGKAITVASEYIMDGSTDHINNTIIDGSQNSEPEFGSVVSFVHGEDTTSLLIGFTIQGGTGTLTNVYDGARIGGGVLCLNSGARIMNNRIFYNTVTHETFAIGGGIGCFTESLEQWVVISSNTILYNSNHAYGDETEWRSAAGGGVYVHSNGRIADNDINTNQCFSGYAADGAGVEIESNYQGGEPFHVMFTGNVIHYNIAIGQQLTFGGGLSIYYSRMDIIDNVISNNSLTSDGLNLGAGINLFGLQDFGDTVIIRNNEINGNMSGGAGGGAGSAISVLDADHRIEIRNNLIQGNGHIGEASSYGAISIQFNTLEMGQSSRVIIDGNRFEMNEMRNGAGVSAQNLFNFSISNNLFLENTAEYGGAIYLFGQPALGTMSCIANNNFINNSAVIQGGALYLEYETESIATFNNIFWQNNASSGAEIFSLIPTPLLVAYSNIDTNAISGLWTGEGNFPEDPGLEEDYLHITDDSPCYNTGATTILYGDYTLQCTDIDFEGDSRPMFGSVDVGLDEYSIVGVPHTESREELSYTVYPNPFSDQTTFRFHLDEPANCIMEIFDMTGSKIEILADRPFTAGEHQLTWQATGIPGGIYFIRLTTGEYTTTAKVIHHR